MPDFSKFDTETPEEKQEGYLDYLITQRKKEKFEKKLHNLYFPTKRFNILRYPRYIFAAALALLAAYVVSCIPRTVSSELEGILFTPYTDHYETVAISVEGEVTHILFQDPVFEGYIRIDNVPYSQNQCLPIVFVDNFDSAGWLLYNEIKYGEPHMYSFGMLYTDRRFKNLVIDMRFHQEPKTLGDPSVEWGPILCAPANSFEEALAMAENTELTVPLEETSQYF